MHHGRKPGTDAARDLLALASSTGGLEALRIVLGTLPRGYPAAIAIVHHRMPAHAHLLCELLSEWSALDIRDASEGDRLLPGRVLIAPPDRHMIVRPDRTITLRDGPPVHHVLSSADPLFESAAAVYGARLTAIVLTGHDGDGSGGVREVRRHGGTVIAQDPATAMCGDMPRSSIATGSVDLVLTLEEIAARLLARGVDELVRSRAAADASSDRPADHS
jgi:two-component system chemotaxis response regulator CheB